MTSNVEKKMQVTMLSNEYPPDFIGGAGVFAKKLSEGLVKKGHKVSVIMNPYGVGYVTGNETSLYEKKQINGVEVIPLNYNFIKLAMNMSGYFGSNREEITKIKKTSSDILHLHNISGYGPKILKKLNNIVDSPKIMTVHDNWFICPFRHKDKDNCRIGCTLCKYNKFKIPIVHPAKYIDYLDVLVFPSLYYKKIFQDYFGNSLPESVVITNFTEDLKDTIDKKAVQNLKENLDIDNERVILYTGMITESKGMRELIRATKFIDDAKIILVGKDKDGILKNLPEKYKNKIIYPGEIPSESNHLYNFYSLADVFVLPSHLENCPLSIIEAMCFELPIFATNVGGIPELVKPGVNGGLINISEMKNLGNLLNKFIHNFDLKKMGERSRKQYKENYTLKKGVEKYEKLYSKWSM